VNYQLLNVVAKRSFSAIFTKSVSEAACHPYGTLSKEILDESRAKDIVTIGSATG